jgi:hypothetical protein
MGGVRGKGGGRGGGAEEGWVACVWVCVCVCVGSQTDHTIRERARKDGPYSQTA